MAVPSKPAIVSSGEASPSGRTFVPDPADVLTLQQSIEEVESHPERSIALTPEQLKHWAETGEWPESLG